MEFEPKFSMVCNACENDEDIHMVVELVEDMLIMTTTCPCGEKEEIQVQAEIVPNHKGALQ